MPNIKLKYLKGRWIAGNLDFPGLKTHGQTRDLALQTLLLKSAHEPLPRWAELRYDPARRLFFARHWRFGGISVQADTAQAAFDLLRARCLQLNIAPVNA